MVARLPASDREHLSVRQTEALVATGEPTPPKTRVRKDSAEPAVDAVGEWKAPPRPRARAAPPPAVSAPRSSIRVKAQDRGQIVIDFNTQETSSTASTALIRG